MHSQKIHIRNTLWKITILKTENQCLRDKVKNQQAVIEILITGDKCENEWKIVKNDKIKTNTEETSACLIPSKVPLPVNLQNWFSSLIVTEEGSIEQ